MNVADRVIAVCENLSGMEAHPDSRLVEDLDLDSLDRIQLAMELEDHFKIEISDAEVDDQKLGVVSGLIACVEAKIAQTPIAAGGAAGGSAVGGYRPGTVARSSADRPGAEL